MKYNMALNTVLPPRTDLTLWPLASQVRYAVTFVRTSPSVCLTNAWAEPGSQLVLTTLLSQLTPLPPYPKSNLKYYAASKANRLSSKCSFFRVKPAFLLQKQADVDRLYGSLLDMFNPFAQRVSKEEGIIQGVCRYLTQFYFDKALEYPSLHVIGGKGTGFTRIVGSYMNIK